MSSIISAYRGSTLLYSRRVEKESILDSTAEPSGTDGDTVELSTRNRAFLLEDLDTAGLFKPAKTLAIGSEAHKAFRNLLETVKSQKSALTDQIEAVLKKNGISLANLDRIKIETDTAGRILVGGIEDKNTAAAIQKALNREKGLAGQITAYRNNEQELSNQIRDYTGCTLYELTMTARGAVNERIRSTIEQDGAYRPDADYFMRLGFLDMDPSILSGDDIAALSFNGTLDFSGELGLMGDPGQGIRDAMDDMLGRVREAFDEINAELLERLEKSDDAMGKEESARRLLNADELSITVDSRGRVKIDGRAAEDDEANARGVAIVERLALRMLLETGRNSYGVNLFTASSRALIDRESANSLDTVVTATMRRGIVQNISLTSGGGDTRERRLQSMLNRASVGVRK